VPCPYGKTARNSILNESAPTCDSVEFVVRNSGEGDGARGQAHRAGQQHPRVGRSGLVEITNED